MSATKRSSGFSSNNGHPSSVISYIGGKSALINNIVPVITYAATTYGLSSYYEMCGGGARMLLNTPPTIFNHRAYSDMDIGLCNLFACLGDKGCLYDLMALLEDLGVGEEVFIRAKHAQEYEARMMSHGSDFELNRLTSAAYTFILAMQSRAADMDTFDNSRVSDPKRLRAYFKRVRELDRFYPTLADVEVTHGDCRELLDLHGEDSLAFGYFDPPYAPQSMVLTDHYGERSWTVNDHELLVDKLLVANMKVALSGYNNESYARLVEAGWERLYLKNVHVSSAANGRRSEEYLWINFKIPSSLLAQISEIDYSAF